MPYYDTTHSAVQVTRHHTRLQPHVYSSPVSSTSLFLVPCHLSTVLIGLYSLYPVIIHHLLTDLYPVIIHHLLTELYPVIIMHGVLCMTNLIGAYQVDNLSKLLFQLKHSNLELKS